MGGISLHRESKLPMLAFYVKVLRIPLTHLSIHDLREAYSVFGQKASFLVSRVTDLFLANLTLNKW